MKKCYVQCRATKFHTAKVGYEAEYFIEEQQCDLALPQFPVTRISNYLLNLDHTEFIQFAAHFDNSQNFH